MTVSLRPHWMQYVIDEFLCLLLLVATLGVYFFAWFRYHEYYIYGSLVCFLYLFARALYLLRMEYVITGEQLIILHGVLSHSTDYVELYRVVDYQQHRTFWQQVFGLKSVTIYSGDRNNPRVTMIGVRENVDVVSEIRNRVEFNKRRRGIYEFTNQN